MRAGFEPLTDKLTPQNSKTDLASGLFNRLRKYDGKAVTILGELEAEYADYPDYLDGLIVLMADRETVVSDGATWLIKSALEKGGRLSPDQAAQFVGHFCALEGWAGKLHVCQTMQYIEIPCDRADTAAQWVTGLLEHDRPFVRAWAIDALCRIAVQHASFRDVASDAVQNGGRDNAASVRARCRKLDVMMKSGKSL